MNIVVLILDDEGIIRTYIRDLVKEFLPQAIIFTAKNPNEALAVLNEEKVDILFLDIKMPAMTGFEFLGLVDDRSFELIFVTAYSDYTINAIRENAFDYLLKPIKKSDFQNCMERVVQKLNDKQLERVSGDENYLSNKLCLTHQQGVNWITLRDIIYLEASKSYTILHIANGARITMAKSIGKFEEKLHPAHFFRIHKSYLINLSHFLEYSTRENGIAIMDNGDKLCISRYKLAELLTLIKNISGELKL